MRFLALIVILSTCLSASAQEQHVWKHVPKGRFGLEGCYVKDPVTKGPSFKKVWDHKCKTMPTVVFWESRIQDGIPVGRCLEVDVQTRGLKFRTLLLPSNCLPFNMETTFVWMKRDGSDKHECREVDVKTRGHKYSYQVLERNCRY